MKAAILILALSILSGCAALNEAQERWNEGRREHYERMRTDPAYADREYRRQEAAQQRAHERAMQEKALERSGGGMGGDWGGTTTRCRSDGAGGMICTTD